MSEGTSNAGAHVSSRWAQWRQAIDIGDYERRFAEMDAAGQSTHGEADFIERLHPASVLDAGCGTGRVAIELARRGLEVVGVDMDGDMIDAARAKAPAMTWYTHDLATLDLQRQFDVVAMPGNVMIFCEPADRAGVVAGCARHLAPDGLLVAGFSLERRADAITLAIYDAACDRLGLQLDSRFATWDGDLFTGGDYAVSVHRR